MSEWHCKTCGERIGRTALYCDRCNCVRVLWRDLCLSLLWIAMLAGVVYCLFS